MDRHVRVLQRRIEAGAVRRRDLRRERARDEHEQNRNEDAVAEATVDDDVTPAPEEVGNRAVIDDGNSRSSLDVAQLEAQPAGPMRVARRLPYHLADERHLSGVSPELARAQRRRSA